MGVVALYNYDTWFGGKDTNTVGPSQMMFVKLAIGAFAGALVGAFLVFNIARAPGRSSRKSNALFTVSSAEPPAGLDVVMSEV
mgnify:CR=1 FL=1